MAGLGAYGLDSGQLKARDRSRVGGSRLYSGWLVGASALTLAIIAAILGTILVKGVPAISWEFVSSPPTEGMTAGGIWPMIRGSLLLIAGTFAFVLPVGVFGGIFLSEYAGNGKATQAIRGCVTSLAGTPAIVYGLFGFAVFVVSLKLGVSLLAGWLTLALFALPVIVLSTENAIKLVPDTLTEGALALGLSKWQTLWRVVLPNALPGIVTGVVLASGRAAGEAAPILLTAGLYYRSGNPPTGFEALKSGVENLPYHLAEGYRQGGKIPESNIWGTCLMLMFIVLFINLGAIIIRARSRRKRLA